jgi:hypothetical protein
VFWSTDTLLALGGFVLVAVLIAILTIEIRMLVEKWRR